MIKIGDIVKVISTTKYGDEKKEFIPIGTICRVDEINQDGDDQPYVGITPLNGNVTFYYLLDEIEKGHMEWVKDE